MDQQRRIRRAAGTTVALAALTLCLLSTVAAANGLVGVRAAAVRDAAQPHAAITAARVESTADGATLSFDLSAPLEAKAFVMADPDRVVVDLPQVDFALDGKAGRVAAGRHARKSLIGSFRFGLLAPGRSRIVIDLAEPARIDRAEAKLVNGKLKLVVTLARTDRAAFVAAVTSSTPAPVVAPAVLSAVPGKPTIVIDPGHGGPDNGAMVGGVIEKDVTLAFAKQLAGKLEASGHFNVVMSRATDVFVPLSERVRIARSAGAALMISVHADTLPESADVSGATVYTVSDKASDAYAAKVAAKENDADAAVGCRRAGRRRRRQRHPVRPDAAGDARLQPRLRPHAGELLEGGGAPEQEPAARRRFRGAEGAGRAVRAARARLPVQPAGFGAADFEDVARGGDRPDGRGDPRLFRRPARAGEGCGRRADSGAAVFRRAPDRAMIVATPASMPRPEERTGPDARNL